MTRLRQAGLGAGAGACLLVLPLAPVVRPAALPSGASPQSLAERAYERMSPAERIGQLFMAGVPSTGASSALRARLRNHHVGNVILDSNSAAGASATAGTVRALRHSTSYAAVKPFVSTDQEGGEVQRLTGSGFDTMPAALAQGRETPAALRADAKRWGRQLLAAGVTLDLAPVSDVVPAHDASDNQPIGRYDREYGHRPKPVAHHVVAVVDGMASAGEATTVKHFPGLGRATGNTDTTSHVTDPTTRHDPYLRPFAKAVQAGVPFVMVSSATYPRIDPSHKACFSHTVVTGMLRDDLRFDGVVISDDLTASPLDRIPAATRSVRWLRAGGDMLLVTDPGVIGPMTRAIRARAADHPAFAAAVKQAVLTVLRAKAAAGLVGR